MCNNSWRKLLNEELHNFFSSPNIRMMKVRGMRSMWVIKNAYRS
jgi:hypothetical protein